MEFCYLNPDMDPARYQLDPDPVVSRMTSFLATV
jgi:hypothetical protein